MVISFIFFCLSLPVGLVNANASTADEVAVEKAILSRIKPAAQLCIEGEPCEAPSAAPAPATSSSQGPRTAEAIYKQYCSLCHNAGVAGAPKFKDAKAWMAYAEKGIDTLLTNAIQGVKAMPPKGTCMNCSDEELKATIEYMLASSK
jgi:cytochrome c5